MLGELRAVFDINFDDEYELFCVISKVKDKNDYMELCKRIIDFKIRSGERNINEERFLV